MVRTGVESIEGQVHLVTEIWPGEVRWSALDRPFARAWFSVEENAWIGEVYDRKGEQVLYEFGGVTAQGVLDTLIVARNVGDFVAQIFMIAFGDDQSLRGFADALSSGNQRISFRFDGDAVRGIS